MNIMLDLETLDTKPGAVITSIAAVPFMVTKTGVFVCKEPFLARIDIHDSLRYGFKMDSRTLFWWHEQDREVFLTEMLGNEALKAALLGFSDYIKRLKLKNAKIWGNGATFDCSILRFAYDSLNIRLPWNSFNERDLRTITDLKPEIKRNAVFKGDKHNPVDDCRHQIRVYASVLKELSNYEMPLCA